MEKKNLRRQRKTALHQVRKERRTGPNLKGRESPSLGDDKEILGKSLKRETATILGPL